MILSHNKRVHACCFLAQQFVLSDGRNTAEQGRTKAEQGGTKPNMAEQAEQGKTKAELFRPLCAQGPYPPTRREMTLAR